MTHNASRPDDAYDFVPVDPYAEPMPDPSWFPQPRPARVAPAPRVTRSKLDTLRPVAPRRVQEPEVDWTEPLRPRRVARHSHLPRYAAAGLVAVVIGSGSGYAVNHYRILDSATAVSVAAPLAQPAETAKNTTTVARKSQGAAHLDVADITGGTNSLIPMALKAEPGPAGEDLILRISGLPPAAYLTAGARAGTNDWQLAASEADDVKLVVPPGGAGNFDLAVAAFDKQSGELAAPVKEIQVAITDPSVQISPASAAPEGTAGHARAAGASAEIVEAHRLVAKGDILLKSGDFDMARQFYERAFAQGLVEAALGAGKTFDPLVYRDLKVVGLKPDPAKALEWYQRAAAAGNSEAKAAITALNQTAP